MIKKSEWLDWKNSKVTEKLVELVKAGKDAAIGDLISARGETGDFYRGANFAFDETLDLIRLGWDMYEEEDKK